MKNIISKIASIFLRIESGLSPVEIIDLPTDKVVDLFLADILAGIKLQCAIEIIITSDYQFSNPNKLLKLKEKTSYSNWKTAYKLSRRTFSCEDSGWTLAHILATYGYIFDVSELIKIGNPQSWNGWTVAHEMASKGYSFSVAELEKLGNPVDKNGRTVAHAAALAGYQFSFSELMLLGNPSDRLKQTIAIIQLDDKWKGSVERGKAEQRRLFTFEEILQLESKNGPERVYALAFQAAKYGAEFTLEQIENLGNPVGSGETIPILMARSGHYFTFYEIVHLNNPADHYGATLAHWMARYGYHFSLNELLQLGHSKISCPDVLYDHIDDISFWEVSNEECYNDKSDLMHNGATIAHIMAREGHRFTIDEIEELGNPKDADGLTLANWMEKGMQR